LSYWSKVNLTRFAEAVQARVRDHRSKSRVQTLSAARGLYLPRSGKQNPCSVSGRTSTRCLTPALSITLVNAVIVSGGAERSTSAKPVVQLEVNADYETGNQSNSLKLAWNFDWRTKFCQPATSLPQH